MSALLAGFLGSLPADVRRATDANTMATSTRRWEVNEDGVIRPLNSSRSAQAERKRFLFEDFLIALWHPTFTVFLDSTMEENCAPSTQTAQMEEADLSDAIRRSRFARGMDYTDERSL